MEPPIRQGAAKHAKKRQIRGGMEEAMEAGDGASKETEVTLAPSDLPGQAAYHLLNALVSPRPIAWVSTVGPDGVPNVAPHSYFTVLSYQPPILGFVSIGEKDTIRNVRAAGEYAVNIVGY